MSTPQVLMLSGEDIVRLILDGTVVRVRLNRKATSISLLAVLGIRSDGQKMPLSVRNMALMACALLLVWSFWMSLLRDLS